MNQLTVLGDFDSYGKINLNIANISYLSASYVNISKDITVLGNTALYNLNVSDNVKMLVSGFLDGKVLFVISFNYNSPEFVKEVERHLIKHLPDGDITSRYVRSVKFNYKHFMTSDSLKIEYLVPELSKFESKFTKPFYSSIIKHESNK
jgi:hypothetical protein